MKIKYENELLYSIKFTHEELSDIHRIANKNNETVPDCLTAFISCCLLGYNGYLQESDGKHELEGKSQ